MQKAIKMREKEFFFLLGNERIRKAMREGGERKMAK